MAVSVTESTAYLRRKLSAVLLAVALEADTLVRRSEPKFFLNPVLRLASKTA
jgi:hypothetical protein